MNLLRSRTALAVAASAALVSASVVATAGPASAAELNPANEIDGGAYTMTLTPNERVGYDPDWDATALYIAPGKVDVSTGCPVGYRASSRSYILTPDGTTTEVEQRDVQGKPAVRTDPQWTGSGLSGEPISMAPDNNVLGPDFTRLDETTLPTGINRLLITCDAAVSTVEDPIGTSKYFVAYLQVDRAAESWKVVPKPGGTVKSPTTTSVAATGVTETAATLTATVAPAGATGTVQFSKDGVALDGPVNVADGTASRSVSGLTANTNYTFTAAYSGDATHDASTGTVTVKTAGTTTPGDGADIPIGVDVPAVGGPSGLKITVKPTAISLSGAGSRASGETWTATGLIDNVTVNDDRRNAGGANWTLNGKVSAFTSGTNSIPGSNLGWAPEKISGAGLAGEAVVAGTGSGLSVDQPLAKGSASATGNVETKVKATLTLKVPAAAPSGAYSGTLSLTLI